MIMAMNSVNMATEILAAIDTLSDDDKKDRSKVWQKITGAIIAHIQTNAVINTNVAVTSVSLVTPGVGASGPGTGTGTGTIA